MQIQFLWWENCPSHPEAWARLNRVLNELGVDAHVERVQIQTEEEAARWSFPGSPTILINGVDIDPAAPAASRLTCRLYIHENGRPSPLPSEEIIRRAIMRALETD